MAIIGWYYLHINGSLIYKPDHEGTAADIRESDFARALWPCDPFDREQCWNILIEAAALEAKPERIKDLALKWGCNDFDADIYARRVGCILSRDGNAWMASRPDFTNLLESPVGFGETKLEAMAALCKELGYKGGKMWGNHFIDLLKKGKT